MHYFGVTCVFPRAGIDGLLSEHVVRDVIGATAEGARASSLRNMQVRSRVYGLIDVEEEPCQSRHN